MSSQKEKRWRRFCGNDSFRHTQLQWLVAHFLSLSGRATKQSGKGHSIYLDIHTRIHEHLASLRAALGDQDKPLIVIAHSLGRVIMSDHIWDEQQINQVHNKESLKAILVY